MALHNMVWDGLKKTAQKIDMTAEEETAELARWNMEDEKAKSQPKILSSEERITQLEATVNALLKGGANATN